MPTWPAWSSTVNVASVLTPNTSSGGSTSGDGIAARWMTASQSRNARATASTSRASPTTTSVAGNGSSGSSRTSAVDGIDSAASSSRVARPIMPAAPVTSTRPLPQLTSGFGARAAARVRACPGIHGFMEFRVLGPLQVLDRIGPITLGGPRQRAVLAALLLEPNRVVYMDRLIDWLWGEHPPSRASGTLQAYVSNLRRLLGGPDRLVWRPPGYLLRIDPDAVDAVRFERLLDEARSAPDPATAEPLLAAARALWRGPLLADLTAVDVPERVRLD